MATLKLQSAEVRLSKAERAALERSLKDLVSRTSKKQHAELDQRFKRTKSFRNLLETELKKVNFDLEKLRDYVSRQHSRRKGAFMAEARKRGVAKRRSRGGRKKAVWGLRSGSERPTYDFHWTFHDVIGEPSFSPFVTIAESTTGYLNVASHAADSRPRTTDSYAGVGFWYIPNTVGTLSISIAPFLSEWGWTHVVWDDLAAIGGWISLGIARYLREPFRFIDWCVIDTDQLFWFVDNWFHHTSHDRERTAYSMSVSTIADTSHYYACWAWVRAYAYAQNGESHASAAVHADVGSFTYSLI